MADPEYAAFRELVDLSMEELCREQFRVDRECARIKNERIAVRNLVRIFNAALSLSNRKGFAAMSLRELSAEAGLSMGALYNYFASKDQLLAMIQRQGRAVVTRVLESQVEAETGPRPRLRRAIQAHLFLSEALQPWFYVAYMETRHLGREEHRQAMAAELATETLFADIIRQGQAQGVFLPMDAELLAGLIKAMLQDWYLKRWKHKRRGVAVERYAALVADLVEARLVATRPG
jgi:AcrR family transcriptional regulator